jgi:hypothetical protein
MHQTDIMALKQNPRETNSLRIGWILMGDRNWASSRMQGYHIHNWLLEQGYDSRILGENLITMTSAYSVRFLSLALCIRKSKPTHLVLQNPTWTMEYLAKLARHWGISTIGVRCDQLSGNYDQLFDLTVVPTEGLAKELGIVNFIAIEDVIEVPDGCFKRSYKSQEIIKVAWVGHPDYEPFLTDWIHQVQSHPEIQHQFQFEIISKGDFATITWREHSVFQDVIDCDIAIIPLPTSQWYVNKSTNRLAMMFALGMPVIASPLPSYLTLGKHGLNMLFAESPEQAQEHLIYLKSQSARQKLGTEARKSLGDRFSVDRIGAMWMNALAGIPRAPLPSTPLGWKLRIIDLITRILSLAK